MFGTEAGASGPLIPTMPIVTVYTATGSTTHQFNKDTTWVRVIVTGGGNNGQVYSSDGNWTFPAPHPGSTGIKHFNLADVSGSIATVVVGATRGTSSFVLGSISVSAPGGTSSGGNTGPISSGGDLNLRATRTEQYRWIGGTPGEARVSGSYGAPFWNAGNWGGGGQGAPQGIEGKPGSSGVVAIEEYR
jgi:hypothetical protein